MLPPHCWLTPKADASLLLGFVCCVLQHLYDGFAVSPIAHVLGSIALLVSQEGIWMAAEWLTPHVLLDTADAEVTGGRNNDGKQSTLRTYVLYRMVMHVLYCTVLLVADAWGQLGIENVERWIQNMNKNPNGHQFIPLPCTCTGVQQILDDDEVARR